MKRLREFILFVSLMLFFNLVCRTSAEEPRDNICLALPSLLSFDRGKSCGEKGFDALICRWRPAELTAGCVAMSGAPSASEVTEGQDKNSQSEMLTTLEQSSMVPGIDRSGGPEAAREEVQLRRFLSALQTETLLPLAGISSALVATSPSGGAVFASVGQR